MTNEDEIMQNEEMIRREVSKRLEEIRALPFTLAVLGQTGVGKSSLINALTGAQLPTGAVRPCTKEISDPVSIRDPEGQEIWFYDLPGIGESVTADAGYISDYAEILEEVDAALWLIHADSRSVTFEVEALNRMLEPLTEDRRRLLLNKLTLVLSKCDLLTSPPWIYAKENQDGAFVPQKELQALFDAKSQYFAEALLSPFAKYLEATTYLDMKWNLKDPRFEVQKDKILFSGFLSVDLAEKLKAQYPQGAEVIDRLADNHRAIVCSSVFRFNLFQLLNVIVNKLGLEATQRFQKVLHTDHLSSVPFAKAATLCNMIVLDQTKGQVVFDLTRQAT